ncbi:M50 family metallopeptidase [Gelria sp. Kuro-4]|uniref:M50 family metallopeptidase n=1 Tax=Gelria sp. Kuro-4 TaxID=2796927 RepID=UPI001BF044D6|nr:M50 family metallopeptidase [Gelria sp. Kuro-4]BCV24558.1 peptidase M50 [Gelria sp. Kuro-4]
MRVGRILGVRIVLNNFFFLALLAYAWLGLLPEVLTLFGAALLHELAHMVVARAYGLTVREMELLPFGGVARIEDLDLAGLDPETETAVALAGPAENVILAGAAWLLAGYGVWDLSSAGLFLRANLSLALFNLLPGLPLDGGRVLRALLSRHLPWRQATDLTARLGQALGALLVCLGAAFYRERMAALTTALLGGFLLAAAGEERRWAGLALLRYLARQRSRLATGEVLAGQPLVATTDTRLKEVVRAFAAGRYQLIWVVGEGHRLRGLLGEEEFVAAFLHLGPAATLGEALERRK